MARVQIERAAVTPAAAPKFSSNFAAALTSVFGLRPTRTSSATKPATTPTPAESSPPISSSVTNFLTTQSPSTLTDVHHASIPAIHATVSANQSQNSTSHDTGETASKSVFTPALPALPTSQPAINSPAQNHGSTSSSRTVPIGVLIGAVLAAVVLSTGAALCFCYFRIRRRRRVARLARRMSTSTGNGVPSPFLLSRQAIDPYSFSNADDMRENMTSELIAATPQRRSIGKGSHRNPAAAPDSTPQRSMDLTPGQRGNGNTGRRAVDAGPVVNDAEDEDEDEDEVESTLPPEYRDVFTTTSRSATVSSRS